MAMKSPTQARQQGGGACHPRSPGRVDVEAELGIQPVRRPMDIEHDVNDLGQKKRVSSVLRSPLFKDELETVVTDLLRSGDGGGHVIAREIANILSPINRSQYSLGDSTLGLKTGVGCVSPINDITGSDTSLYTKGEKLMRCKLAALYRLVDLNGWSQSIYNHISLRVSQEQEHFLINPFGLLYHEVSASKLLKITMQGEVVDQGTTTFSLNKAGFVIHSAIHSARPDLKCVIHVHTPDVVAVSMMECGLLPISQEAMIVGDVSFHNYQGLAVDPKEKKLLIKHLGPNNKVMFLRNHGLVACGETVEEAYHYLYHVMLACQTQVKAMSCVKHEKLIHLDKSLKTKTQDIVTSGADQMAGNEDEIKWEIGEMMFEANMRMLDNMGYRTGFLFRNPVTLHRRSKLRSDVELPATAHGQTPILLDDIEDGRARLHSHPPGGRWVNSPNQYTKVKTIPEEGSAPGSGSASVNGDVSPKSRTKWRNEEGSSHSTPIRIADANQFVPKNTDPREVAEKRKKIRGQGRWDEMTPGPQSQKLDSVAPVERRGPPQCFIDSYLSTAYDAVKLEDSAEEGVTTGSKGIIQRDFHSETIVTGPPNPFSSISEEELKSYQMEVTRKAKTESENEEVFEKQTAVEHTVEVQPSADETDGGAPVNGVEMQSQVQVNGTDESKPSMKDEAAPPIVVTLPSPPEPVHPTNVDESKAEEAQQEVPSAAAAPVIQETRDQKTPTPPPSDKKSKPSEKVNGKDVDKTPAPKAKPEPEPAKATPEAKDDPKSKQKKSKKRRSLSFLKKNKDKKDHKE